MKQEHEQKQSFKTVLRRLDFSLILIPLFAVTALCVLFILYPSSSARVTDAIRGFLGDKFGFFYIVLGFVVLCITMYLAFSKYGNIRLGKTDKPEYPNFQWATMIFTGVFAADIIYYSFIEWALYAQHPHIQAQSDAAILSATYPLFHWGPIPWAFYVMLAVAFGFMLHVRKHNVQKFSEACRPLLGDRADRLPGKLIDLVAILALLAGTATTFSLATPLLSAALCRVFGFSSTTALTIFVLLCIALVYTISVLSGIKGIIKSAAICTTLFFAMLVYILCFGGETVFILETGVSSVGKLLQNFVGMATWMDPLRETGFVQDWTIFYWAYWMAWCVATPFFIGMISRGRTIRNVVLGTYAYGLSGTFLSFIIFGNYGLSQQLSGAVDVVGTVAGGHDMNIAIVQIFDTLPLSKVLLIVLFIMMVTFYSTTFDSLTLVVSAYSYRRLESGQEAHRVVRAFWALLFIVFPLGLIFADNAVMTLQSVSIIAAFPIGIVMILMIVSFFRDARIYLREGEQNKR